MTAPAFSSMFIYEREEENKLENLMSHEGYKDSRLRLLMRDYYAACCEERPVIHSIAVEDALGPVLLMPMVLRNRQLSYFDMPASAVYANRLSETERIRVLEAACNLAIDYCLKTGTGLIITRSSAVVNRIEIAKWEVKILQAGGQQITNYRGLLSLANKDEKILNQMRKSYRSLVNWGRREMQILFVDTTKLDEQLFNNFRQFHLQVAGRVTRPQASWTAMYELLKQGKAILGLGYLKGELVAATYFFYHAGFALYGSGVYDRMHFDKPISHWPVFATLQRAIDSGVILCDLGQVFPNLGFSDKERNIAFFKKGFTNIIVDDAYWQLDPKNTQE